MGVDIECDEFAEQDYARFEERLRESVVALRELLARPGFGEGPTTLGAELELHLVDARGRPAPVNRAVIADAVDRRIAPEIDSFNIELNAAPVLLAGRPFTELADQLVDLLRTSCTAAAAHGARVVSIGLLPTLTERDLGRAALSDFKRYRALSAAIRRRRERPLMLRIAGDELLETIAEDVTFEGANTSFQIHVRVSPDAFARTYNAAQIAAAPALAASTNSPLFLGKRLWEETRIPLFRQSVDDRCDVRDDDWRPARVSFGHGWVRRSAAELFAESVAIYDPLLPVLTPVSPLEIVRAGQVPALAELRLHEGTVWRWNRGVYDDSAGGHLRIEIRALPSGPTVRDMVASAAFVVGLTLGLAPHAEELVTRITFGQARRNFYEAARVGLDAMLVWPEAGRALVRARDLVERLIPIARRGLVESGVAGDEADVWLSIVQRRCAVGTTGARWQRRIFDRHCLACGPDEAARLMLEAYIEENASGKTVDAWSASP
ncbi:MAG: Glutamate-cysteine ligase family protein [Labilithrix sp.]|nr:Glutamate-cysteine ligase family protein [Labilithrix sp.]